MIRAFCLLVGMLVPAAPAPQTPPPAPPGRPPGAWAPQPPQPPQTGDLTDPIAILKRVDAAAKAVQTVRYKGVSRHTGYLADRKPVVEGVVLLGKPGPYYGFGQFVFDVLVTEPGGEVKRRVTTGSDLKSAWLIDHDAKRVQRREVKFPSDYFMGLGRTGMTCTYPGMIEFVHATPFDDEINGLTVALLGARTVNGEECYVVDVVYTAGRGQSIWSFSKKDFLPRQREMIVIDPRTGQRGARVITIDQIEVNPKLADDAFEPRIPEGYQDADEGSR